jgi:hypothetical protein
LRVEGNDGDDRRVNSTLGSRLKASPHRLRVALVVGVALAPSCGPASELHEALSAVGITRDSLVKVAVHYPEGENVREPARLDSAAFWKFMEGAGPPGHWCSCVEGTVLLFTSKSGATFAAKILVQEGEGMKLKAGAQVVEFEASALRAAVRQVLATAVE